MAAPTQTQPILDNNGGFGNFEDFDTPASNEAGYEAPRETTASRDYAGTDEWDASKVPPSRFQKRKGSIYATPSSRDGHVERNRDATDAFHEAHRKRFSFGGKSKETKEAKEARKNSK